MWIKSAWFDSVRNLVSHPALAPQPVVRNIGELKNLRNEWPWVLRIQTVTGKPLWFDLVTGRQAR